MTQNGGMGRGPRTTPGIQRVSTDGEVTVVVTEVAGLTLEGPNDLAVGDDGRLWFTDPRGDADPAANDRPGRIFAVDPATGDGELVVELGPVFPNGIAFLADGTLVWTESFSRRVMAMVDGRARARHRAARAAPSRRVVRRRRRSAVRSVDVRALRVSVVEDGAIVDRYMCGDGMVTNCCFGGTDLYVTESRHGTLWRYPLGVEGLPLPRLTSPPTLSDDADQGGTVVSDFGSSTPPDPPQPGSGPPPPPPPPFGQAPYGGQPGRGSVS